MGQRFPYVGINGQGMLIFMRLPWVSDVVRIALTKIAKEKALPFEMRIPNALTVETLAKSERGEDVYHAEDAEDLFKQLQPLR
jgi:addiction module RelB/DinJ family antitoxin